MAAGVIKELSKEERSYYTAEDVQVLMGVSRSKAYNMIDGLRQELVSAGKLFPGYKAGRIPKRYFNERCMIE